MNLHSIVAPCISVINPMTTVAGLISSGVAATRSDGVPIPGYQTPGDVVASIAANSTVLTVSQVNSGYLAPGQGLSDTTSALQPGTTITAQLSGTPGGVGTYSVSVQQTVASEEMTTSLSFVAQVQALSTRDLRMVEGLNLQGTLKAVYLTGVVRGVVRPTVKGGDLIGLPDGSVWLVTTVPEPWSDTAGWTKAIVTLQNDPALAALMLPSFDFSKKANSMYLGGIK